MAANAFSLPVRERLLALLAVEYSTQEACAVAGISRQTVARWAARGRVPGAPAEHADFATRLDAIREGMAEAVAEAEVVHPPEGACCTSPSPRLPSVRLSRQPG
jgi:Homeodomain-like domain